MSVIGIGIDMVEVSRIEELIEHWGPRFLDKIFTPEEQQTCMHRRFPHIHFSGRFAIKEAMLKALGTGLRSGLRWKDISTINNRLGKPTVQLFGRVRERADQMGVSTIFSSISHEQDYAIAQVLLEGSPPEGIKSP